MIYLDDSWNRMINPVDTTNNDFHTCKAISTKIINENIKITINKAWMTWWGNYELIITE